MQNPVLVETDLEPQRLEWGDVKDESNGLSRIHLESADRLPASCDRTCHGAKYEETRLPFGGSGFGGSSVRFHLDGRGFPTVVPDSEREISGALRGETEEAGVGVVSIDRTDVIELVEHDAIDITIPVANHADHRALLSSKGKSEVNRLGRTDHTAPLSGASNFSGHRRTNESDCNDSDETGEELTEHGRCSLSGEKSWIDCTQESWT